MADLVKRAFASTDLYAILGVERTADAKALKKAYYRKALQFHPDKNPGDEDATAKFQALTLIHALLSDADRRAEYDESGLIDTEADEVSAEWCALRCCGAWPATVPHCLAPQGAILAQPVSQVYHRGH